MTIIFDIYNCWQQINLVISYISVIINLLSTLEYPFRVITLLRCKNRSLNKYQNPSAINQRMHSTKFSMDNKRSNLFKRYDNPSKPPYRLSICNQSADILDVLTHERYKPEQQPKRKNAYPIKYASSQINPCISFECPGGLEQYTSMMNSRHTNVVNMVFKVYHNRRTSGKIVTQPSQHSFVLVRRAEREVSPTVLPSTRKNYMVVEKTKSVLVPLKELERKLLQGTKQEIERRISDISESLRASQQKLSEKSARKDSENSKSVQKPKSKSKSPKHQKSLLYGQINFPLLSSSKTHQRKTSEPTQPKPQPSTPFSSSTNGNDFLLKRRFPNKKDYFVFGLDNRNFNTQNKIELYRDFLWKVNYSNGLLVEPDGKQYKMYLGRGNNCMLVRGLMKRRFWWTIVDRLTEEVNFVWTQLKLPEYFQWQEGKKLGNRMTASTSWTIEHEAENLQSGQSTLVVPTGSKGKDKEKEKAQQQQATDPHSLIFSELDMLDWQQHWLKHKQLEQKLDQKVQLKRAHLLKKKNTTKILNQQPLKVQNHFTCNFFLGNKKAMFYCLRQLCQLTNRNVFQFLPLTFHISKSTQDPQYKKFLTYYQLFRQQKKAGKIQNIWIVKPGELTNRGNGITVCQSLQQVIIRLKSRQRNANGKLRTFIVQKYIERPFLYHRRKFDIRHYMMITCVNGNFRGYWYAEGYIRTTSYEYSVANCKNSLVHLTNDAVQKYSTDYGKYEKGNKISYAEFQKYLDTSHKSRKLRFQETVLPAMRAIATDAVKACYLLLDPQRRAHNFQIFGMDFMIDEDFKPWLIQINTNPCLQLSSPLLSRLIPTMLQNAFKLTIDPLFQPPYDWPSNKKFQMGDNPLETNRFSLMFDEATQGEQLQELFSNVERIDKNMGDIQEEDEEYEDQGKEWNQELAMPV